MECTIARSTTLPSGRRERETLQVEREVEWRRRCLKSRERVDFELLLYFWGREPDRKGRERVDLELPLSGVEI